MRYAVALIGLLFFQVMNLYGGSLILSVDKNEGSIYDQFYLKVKLSGSSSEEIKLPDIPGIEVQEAGVSRSFNMINGSVSKSLEKTFILTAQNPGTYTIPSISMKIDDKMISSNSITLKILDSESESQLHSGSTDRSESQDKAKTKDIFVERKVDKDSLYVGETIEVKSLFYYRTAVTDINSIGQNYSNNFSSIVEKKTRNYSLVKNGIEYNVVELTEVLQVTDASNSTLPPFVVRAMIPSENESSPFGGRGFFDDFFSKTISVPKVFTSGVVKLKIKPLPNPKPKNFSSLVGNFKINASLSDTVVKVADTVTLSVLVEGIGALEGLDEKTLGIKIPDGIKVYPDKPNFSRNEGTFIKESKTFKFALVPTKAGEFNIEDIKLNVFVPKLGDYTNLVAQVGKLTVEENPSASSTASLQEDQSSSKIKTKNSEDVKYLNHDIIDIKRKDNKHVDEITSDTYRVGVLFILLPTLLLMLLLFVKILKFVAKKQDLKKQKAYRKMLALFSKLSSTDVVEQATAKSFKEEFINYLCCLLGEEFRSKTMEEISNFFKSKGTNDERFFELLKLFDEVQYANTTNIKFKPDEISKILLSQIKFLK